MNKNTIGPITPSNDGSVNYNTRSYSLAELNAAIDLALNPPEAVTAYASQVDRRSRLRATRRVIRNLAIAAVGTDTVTE